MFLSPALQGDPLPPSLVDLVRNSPISSVDDLKLLLLQETNAIGTNDHHAYTHTQTHTNKTDVEEVSVWVCLQRPEEIGMQQHISIHARHHVKAIFTRDGSRKDEPA